MCFSNFPIRWCLALLLVSVCAIGLPAAAADAAEAILVKDINPSAEPWVGYRLGGPQCRITCPPPPLLRGSAPRQLTRAGDRVFFTALTFEAGRELWVSDGTGPGTRMVADLCPGPCDSTPRILGALGDELYFFASGEEPSTTAVWRTDGTAEGTRRLPKLCEEGCHEVEAEETGFEFGGSFFFVAPTHVGPDYQRYLWRTDGTESGTQPILYPNSRGTGLIRIIHHGIRAENLEQFPVIGGDLFIDAESALLDSQDRAERRAVVRLKPREQVGVRINGVGPWAGRSANGVTAFRAERSVWVTEGSIAEARLVYDGLDWAEVTYPRLLGWIGRHFYFATKFDGLSTAELWRTDGTAAGTERAARDLKPIRSGFALNGRLFLRPAASSTLQVWDPWAPNPRVEELANNVKNLQVFDSFVLFSGWNEEAGREPWVSDGTVEGTHRLLDLRPGPESSAPISFEVTDRIYFSADDGVHDEELMALPLSAADPGTCVTGADPHVLCLGDGRFQARVRFRNQHAGGAEGTATAVPGTTDAGFFWFFRPGNLELTVKVLDGTGVNGHHWVFYGGITDLEYEVEVTDLENDLVRTFHHAAGDLCGGADTTAFPATEQDLARTGALLAGDSAAAESLNPAAAPSKVTGPTSSAPGCPDSHLCLGDGAGRFQVDVTYRNQHAGGAQGGGRGETLSSDSGWFWFFRYGNPELMVKILDGGEANGHHWVFLGGLTTLEVEVTITDLGSEGRPTKTYVKPAESTCGIADVNAFPAS